MKIIRAKHYGFCFWVKRAYEMVEKETNNKWEIKVWWELIHNKPALDKLRKKWMKTIEEIDQVSWDIVIRSHWISNKKMNQIKKRAWKVMDATCPFVTNVHNCAKRFLKEWRKIVIVWDWNHPEMKWLIEDLDEYYCVLKKEDIDLLPKNLWKIWVVVQTTLKKETYDEILSELEKNFLDIKSKNTICNATTERQWAIKELSKISDIVIIIWWTNSNNSRKLWEISKQNCESYKIETEEEIERKWFEWKETVWISAWASTPEWLIKKVEERIECYNSN